MTDLEKLIVGGVVAVSVGLAVAATKWLASRTAKKIEDVPRVKAKLSMTADQNVVAQIGCPCMVVRLIGASHRATRITGAEISMKVNKEFLQAFDKGFEIPFSEASTEGLPPPKFYIELFGYGTAPKTVAKVERDDVVEFLLPVPFTPYEHFLSAPSQDIEIAIKTSDGERTVVLTGLEIQECIRSLIDFQGDDLRGPKVVMKMGINLSAKKMPPFANKSGTLNTNAVDLPTPPS